MAISEFVSTELVSRANINNRITQANLCFPVSLYSNVSGTTSTVQLSDSAANYNYLEIYFKDNDGEFGCTKVYSPDGKPLLLSTIKVSGGGNRTWLKSQKVSISGTSITFGTDQGQATMVNNDVSSMAVWATISICYVIGYKY